MAVYTYRGRLTDFAQDPFPDAYPRLFVQPVNDAISETHLLSSKRIPVHVEPDGRFAVLLVPSAETTPVTKYRLLCEWLVSDEPVGWSVWEFTAVVGGGDIGTMPNGPVSQVWVGPPWPPSNPRGMYFDRFTNDVGVRY